MYVTTTRLIQCSAENYIYLNNYILWNIFTNNFPTNLPVLSAWKKIRPLRWHWWNRWNKEYLNQLMIRKNGISMAKQIPRKAWWSHQGTTTQQMPVFALSNLQSTHKSKRSNSTFDLPIFLTLRFLFQLDLIHCYISFYKVGKFTIKYEIQSDNSNNQ